MSLVSALHKRWHAPLGYAYILRVGLPLIVGMLSITLMQFVDRIFLGHYSVDAISAAVPAALNFNAALFLIMGTVGYTTVIIAQYLGSGALHRVGPALWQGIWCAVFGGIAMGMLWFVAEPFFAFLGANPAIQKLEVIYFKTLCAGSSVLLINNVLGTFFSGRGETRPVLMANVVATIVKIPCDYLLIFGAFDIIPSLGILGAGLSTIISSCISAILLASLIFKKKYEAMYLTRSGFRPQLDMFKRLLRFGLPSGFNMFMDIAALAWFSTKVGSLHDAAALPASNIALSINQPIFVPMLGLNLAIASLVGRSMGKGHIHEAELLQKNGLHLALLYMIPMALLMATFAGPLVSLFADRNLTVEQFAPIKQVGISLLYYIAIYSLVDAFSIINFGALKGAGDTRGIFIVLCVSLTFFLVAPILTIDFLGMGSVHSYWIVITVYIIILAVGSHLRFKQGKWRTIRVVETARMPSAELEN